MDLANLIVSASIVQALLLIVLLVGSQKVRFTPTYLLLLLAGLLYFQIEFLLVRNAVAFPFKQILLTRHGGWLMIGPLFFAFVQSLYQQVALRRLFLHLTPFLLFALLLPLLLHEPIPKRGFDYSMLTIFVYQDLGMTQTNSLYGIIFLLQFLHVGLYLGLSYRFLGKQQHAPVLPISRSSLLIFSGIYVLSLIFYGVLVTETFYRRVWDYALIVPMAAFVYYLSYLLLTRPEWWRADVKLLKDNKYERSVLPQDEITAILQTLDQTMEEKQLYIDPDLSLSSLAEETGISRHKISQVLNQARKQSFSHYLNQFRVEEAKRLIRENQDSPTLLSIAYQAGFNNKASFNQHFKRETGMTPSAFRKQEQG